jgi:hypothetical protein
MKFNKVETYRVATALPNRWGKILAKLFECKKSPDLEWQMLDLIGDADLKVQVYHYLATKGVLAKE